jgi:hypothetical protein
MIAFSVIVMCSGHTLVQQRVMLQKPMPCVRLERRHAVRRVERVHLERRREGQEPRTDELIVQVMIAQDVADVLAEEALDALPELLHAIDVGCRMRQVPSGAVGRPRR